MVNVYILNLKVLKQLQKNSNKNRCILEQLMIPGRNPMQDPGQDPVQEQEPSQDPVQEWEPSQDPVQDWEPSQDPVQEQEPGQDPT